MAEAACAPIRAPALALIYIKTLSITLVCRGQDGEPLQLLMRGVNLYTGGHFDEYDATFFDYKARPFL